MTKVSTEDDTTKQQIRVCLSNVYDLQKLRIATGNRIVQSFYIQMGISPGTSPKALLEENKDGKESEEEKKKKKFIKQLLSEYQKVTDCVVNENKTVKASIKKLLGSKDPVTLLKSESDYWLMDSYNKLLESEKQATKVVDKYVQQHPLWDAFFKDIKGCGPLMSAVCISYLDPYKARHVSSFYKYCGLDVVHDEDKEGNKLYLSNDGSGERRVLRMQVDVDEEANDTVFRYFDIETNEEYVGDVVPKYHGRRKGDTEMFEYIDKNGDKAMKRGITYNPMVKSKLMGVLAGGLLKAKDPVYAPMYYDYRARLENEKYHKDKNGPQKNMMALRYMMKQFLRNLWTTWRTLEGLDVDLPYEVAKLGNKPHKYNEFQCKSATVDTVDK